MSASPPSEVDAPERRSYAPPDAADAGESPSESDACRVTASEFAFLFMGLVLGVMAGAALVEVLRARPPAPREVRVTVATDAIPRRASTLADAALTSVSAEPARGGPADRRGDPAGPPIGTPDRRTPVRVGVPMTLALSGVGAGSSGAAITGRASDPGTDRVGVPVRGGDDPLLSALRASAAASAVAAMRAAAATTVRDPEPVRTPPAPLVTGPAAGAMLEPDDDLDVTASGGPSPEPAGPCGEQRRLADERCELALRAHANQVQAEERLRVAQREYDDRQARADAAEAAGDPRAVRAAKDEAQAQFRQARNGAITTDEIEAAAREWLLEINRINAQARDAAAIVTHEREAIRALTVDVDRLSVAADTARITAETAEAACLEARVALAACEEAATSPAAGAPVAASGGAPGDGVGTEDEPLVAALGSGGTPRIFRLVRGDRSALLELVTAMAGDDPVQRRHWQLALSDLVDAILADAIAAGSLDFPDDHPFWGPFSTAQDRDIALALSSVGFRFDGLGGWVDGRMPSQRDLSLALGYAGIDPMRIRHWPTEAETRALFADVAVAADERLAGAAGDLTLGELVTMLGRRADGLADVWNHWGTLRPLLLEGS